MENKEYNEYNSTIRTREAQMHLFKDILKDIFTLIEDAEKKGLSRCSLRSIFFNNPINGLLGQRLMEELESRGYIIETRYNTSSNLYILWGEDKREFLKAEEMKIKIKEEVAEEISGFRKGLRDWLYLTEKDHVKGKY